jgi:uncharacterized protein with von Willebrand factor type A (vWA) domain
MSAPRAGGPSAAGRPFDPVGFAVVLRSRGVAVAPHDVTTWLAALAELAPVDPQRLHHAARATLVHRGDDLAAFERSFAEVFLGSQVDHVEPDVPGVSAASGAVAHDLPGREGREVALARWSRAERLRHADLASCDVEELEQIEALLAGWRRSPRRRPGRRRGPGPAALDVRRSLQQSMRNGGELFVATRRPPLRRSVGVVLLLDVSGSMAAYAPMWLRFAHALTHRDRRVEVFVSATRLTRVTAAMRAEDPDVALQRVAERAPDLAGGTRLGEALEGLRRWSTPAPVVRGADLVVLSDGWDRGDPAAISSSMAGLHRLARRVVWVNPLKASEGYAPIARGMAAALGHVDEFLEGHSMASFERLVALLGATREHLGRAGAATAGTVDRDSVGSRR